MTQPDRPDDGAQEDVPRRLMLGERLTVIGERLRARHLPVYAWAAGFAPVLARAEALTLSWERRFERDESGDHRVVLDPRPVRATSSDTEQTKAGIRRPAEADAEPIALAEQADGRQRVLPVDVRARLRKVAGPGADHIRIRTGAAADATARAHHADAVTIGAEVQLRAGRFRPDTPEGFALLAHEASHVTALLAPGGVGRRTSPTGLVAEERSAGQIEGLARLQDPVGAGHRDHVPGPRSGPWAGPGVTVSTTPAPSVPAPLQVGTPPDAATVPMRAEVDRVEAVPQAPVDLEGLRKSLIDDVMHRLRTDSERGG